MNKNNVIKHNFINKGKCDNWIIFLISCIVIFGVVMVYSASYYYSIDEFGTPNHYFYRQIAWVIGGVFLTFIFSKIDYHFYTTKVAYISAYLIGLVLLILVLIDGIGTSAYGATRWIYIGPISIMPGEICKPCLIVAISGYFSKHQKDGPSFLKGTVPVGIMGGIYFGLIMLQPNMSTACTVLFICAGLLIVLGIRWYQFLMCAGAGYGLLVYLINSSEYRRRRLTSFMDPFADEVRLDEGWNAVQSLLALGTGGVFGKGLGNSVQKNLYLPMGHNDFILAIIGEELGYVGIALLMVLYVLLFYRGFLVSIRAKDFEGMIISAGITIWIFVQVVMHFLVVTSSMPPTGVALPFISYGGNSMLLFMAGIGVLLNISKQNNSGVTL